MIKNIYKQSGFTLLELLATIAVSGMMITVIFSVVTATFNQNEKTLSHVNLRQEANLIITDIRNKHQGKKDNFVQEHHIIPINEYHQNNKLKFKTIAIKQYEKDKAGNTIEKTSCSETNDKCLVYTNLDLVIEFILIDVENETNEYQIDTIIESRKFVDPHEIVDAIEIVPPEVGEPSTPKESFFDYLSNEEIGIYSQKYVFYGDKTTGKNTKVVILGDLNDSEFNGGSVSDISNIEVIGSLLIGNGGTSIGSQSNPGKIIVNNDLIISGGNHDIFGDLYINGNFNITGGNIKGNAFVKGNVVLGQYFNINQGSIVKYSGTLSNPFNLSSNITDKFVHVDTMPEVKPIELKTPEIRDDIWFRDNGYITTNTIKDGIKVFTNNFVMKERKSVSNVVIVSKGDIDLSGIGWNTFSGVLYAPNGNVTFDGAKFVGVVISKNGFSATKGGSTVELKNISSYFDNNADLAPFK